MLPWRYKLWRIYRKWGRVDAAVMKVRFMIAGWLAGVFYNDSHTHIWDWNWDKSVELFGLLETWY